jgi:RNA polymerase sigma-B factor
MGRGAKERMASTESRGQKGNGERADEELIARWLSEYARLRSQSSENSRREMLALGELKTRLAHHYTPLVESVARRFVASGEPFEDLVQEGFLGLLSALDNFDQSKGVKFSTYATHFIAGAIRHCLRDRGKIIKEPAWLHELSGRINRATDTLTVQLGRAPHSSEIAQLLNLTEESVEEVLATRQVFHVAAFGASSEDSDDSMVGLVDPEKIRSDHYVTLQLPIEDRIALEEAAAKLKALEQHVLFEFFYKDLNQTEVAKKLGISCNYVSHILRNSTQKIRKMLGEAEVRDRARHAESSVTDAVSGLYTQSHTLARIEEEISRTARAKQTGVLLYFQLDGLPASGIKREEAWAFCGETIQRCIRRIDFAGRGEGDTLLIFLPRTGDCPEDVALQVGTRIADQLVAAGAAHYIPITVQMGTATYPEEGRFFNDLFCAAKRDSESFLSVPAETPDLRLAA